MKTTKKVTRRSFVLQVAGAAIGTGTLAIIHGRAWAQTGPYTGVNDTDSGSYADNAGHGRGPGGNRSGRAGTTGITDNDPRDPAGGGRRRRYSGYSDSDRGPNADPSGGGIHGRTEPRPNNVARQARRREDGVCVIPTGYSDSDRGPSRDPYNYGGLGSGHNLAPRGACPGN